MALIGFGPWGRNIARALHEQGALAAICDRDPTRADEARRLYPQALVFGSLQELMAARPCEAAAVATPAETHFRVAQKLLEQRFHTFVEKPLALSVSEGKELVALASREGRALMVGHLLLYHPAAVALLELVRAGELGRLLYAYSNRLNWGTVRREENILWSFAPHDLALLLAVTGEMPTEVAAFGQNALHPTIADTTVTHLRFPSGLSAHIHVSWLHPFKEQRFVLVGDKRVAVFEDTAPEHKLVVYDHAIDWVDRVPVARKAPGRPIAFPPREALASEMSAFLEAVDSGAPAPTDGRHGVQVLELLEACQRSLEQHGASQAVAVAPPVPAPVTVAPPAPPPGVYVHPTAVVGPNARVGAGSRIWHFCHVMDGAELGERCVLGQNVFVASGVQVGAGCKLQNNVSLYTGVVLEDDVFVGPSAVFTNVRNPRAHVERKDAYEVTRVERGATIGANATIRCGVVLGHHCFVAAGALVTRSVPPHQLVQGSPAVHAGWVCACGEVLPLPAQARSGERAPCARCGRVWLRSPEGLVEATPLAAEPPILG